MVEGYKTVTAYHAGDGVWVEVDVIMAEGEKVGRAHDVVETMQYCLEGLTEVDRAFVSVDCKFSPFFSLPLLFFFLFYFWLHFFHKLDYSPLHLLS